jgi:putative transposase
MEVEMARIARVVVPDAPHHVTQRGNRKEPTFFEDGDYRFYLNLLGECAAKADTKVWAYCLMPNHVHVVLKPSDEDGLRRTFAELHRRYTRYVNFKHGWTGHLWQGRFGSVAMDETHLLNAVRYVSQNPVRARLVARAQDWPWSSVRAHLGGRSDGVVDVTPVLTRVDDFSAFLGANVEDTAFDLLRRSETSGRPLGPAPWIEQLESRTRRSLTPAKRGPKPLFR